MHSEQKSSDRLSFVWLAIGSVLIVFMGGKWNIPVATWLGPVFLLRFFRTQGRWYKSLIALPVFAVAMFVFMQGLLPFPPVVPWGFFVFCILGYALLIAVPYLVDWALYWVLNYPLKVLFFPAAVTAFHFLMAIWAPTGTGAVWGQNLFEFTSLIQIVSVTGVWGLSFLVGWFASTANLIWENEFRIAPVKKPAIAFTIVFCLVWLWGGFRISVLKPTSETVKVGSVLVPWPLGENVFWDYVQSGTPRDKADRFRPALQELQDELFAQSESLIPSGVKLLMWSVGNVTLFEDDEPAFVRRAQAFAQEHQIYFFPSILTMKYDETECENKVLAITPQGEIAYIYYKSRPSPGETLPEAEGKLYTMDTPYGRIATAICYDMYFPDLIHQAGQQQVDILLVPADEPMLELDPFDTESVMFRGIENGVSVLRSTLEGLTMGVDYQGKVLSRMSFWTTTENRTMITHLPSQGVRTLYAVAGDWFAYVAILFLIGAVVWMAYRQVQGKREFS
jgi:apolipoprotein N-acyltransferase